MGAGDGEVSRWFVAVVVLLVIVLVSALNHVTALMLGPQLAILGPASACGQLLARRAEDLAVRGGRATPNCGDFRAAIGEMEGKAGCPPVRGGPWSAAPKNAAPGPRDEALRLDALYGPYLRLRGC
jgi:hypothetical protein